MYSIDIDKDIIIGIEEVSVDSLVPHEKVLIDKPEEHPLPSAPMNPRTMKTDLPKSVWEFIRAGS